MTAQTVPPLLGSVPFHTVGRRCQCAPHKPADGLRNREVTSW